MATKPSDLFGGIPSVPELLERPPVRALIERWNRSVVAGGVRSFLDELRSDVERRVADAGLPSIRELAERAARHVIQMQQPSQKPAINATGRLLDSCWQGRPLADQALERVVAVGRGYVETSESSNSDVTVALARLTGGEAAIVVHSYAGAIWLAMTATSGGKKIIVSRTETGDVSPGCSLLSLAASAAGRVEEIGSANRTAVADYEAAITKSTGAIFKHEPDGYRLAGDVSGADIEELVGLARDRELPLIHAVGSAPLVGGLPVVGEQIPSIAASINARAHLAVVRGDGLVGGPPCGILVGNRDVIGRIAAHPLFEAWQLDALSTAALAATLQLYDDLPHLAESLPLLQLLCASAGNLRQRAERLAPQLAQAEGIEAAEPIATRNDLGIPRFGNTEWPSYGIALSATDGNSPALDKRLRAAAVPVIGRMDGSRLVLDLRTVFPRQDQQILEALAAKNGASSSTAAECSAAAV